MKNKSWQEPLIAMSGNGYHLLYKVELANSTKYKKLVSYMVHILKKEKIQKITQID